MLGTVWAFAYRHRETEKNLWETFIIIIIIIIIIITEIGLLSDGRGYFTCIQNM